MVLMCLSVCIGAFDNVKPACLFYWYSHEKRSVY